MAGVMVAEATEEAEMVEVVKVAETVVVAKVAAVMAVAVGSVAVVMGAGEKGEEAAAPHLANTEVAREEEAAAEGAMEEEVRVAAGRA